MNIEAAGESDRARVLAWTDERKRGAALWLGPGEHPDAWQGCGIGSALMRYAVAKCDETGCRAYLESSNPRNIPLYERHGVNVVGEVRSGDCPALTPMLREPQ